MMVEVEQKPSKSFPPGVTVPGRLGGRVRNLFGAVFGLPWQRRLAQAALAIPKIRKWEAHFESIPEEELHALGRKLKGRARGGESLSTLLPEVFGLVSAASWRYLKMRPFDVQLAAGFIMAHGGLAELATGEGKTLCALLPTALIALEGKGAHVITVNEYLAQRDGEFASPVYKALGLTVGILTGNLKENERRAAYKCDITYGTAMDFGFDFLRDRIRMAGSAGLEAAPFWGAWTSKPGEKPSLDPRVQRGHHFALVDEADSICVDDARSAMIIGARGGLAPPDQVVLYRWADSVVRQMVNGEHFFFSSRRKTLVMKDAGKQLARYSNPPIGKSAEAMDKLHRYIERALHAHHQMKPDISYVVSADKKIVLVDEGSGRLQPDRHLTDGQHQAIEAKEGVPITSSLDRQAQITLQNFFRLYDKLSGMTGTAVQNRWEFWRVYDLWVVQIPTNRPGLRVEMPDRVFPTERAKFEAVVECVKELQGTSRPVLIGTRSLDRSELLSSMLTEAGIEHEVLNARPEVAPREAEIIAQAGAPGAVTIATNMAGRGTDILLGGNPEHLAWQRLKQKYKSRLLIPAAEWKSMVDAVSRELNIPEKKRQVVAAGGLHILATERHENQRIDRQLAGRSARQGDPGSAQFFLSLEDTILEAFGPAAKKYLAEIGRKGEESDWNHYLPLFRKAQRLMEKQFYKQRIDLMAYHKEREELLEQLGADPYVE